jgi:hypothetical protein
VFNTGYMYMYNHGDLKLASCQLSSSGRSSSVSGCATPPTSNDEAFALDLRSLELVGDFEAEKPNLFADAGEIFLLPELDIFGEKQCAGGVSTAWASFPGLLYTEITFLGLFGDMPGLVCPPPAPASGLTLGMRKLPRE